MFCTDYSYWGSYNICNLGGEIRDPERNIARGIFLSILGITALYPAMQTSILGVVPSREAQNSKFIVSTFVERLYGHHAAQAATWMVLGIALTSVFSVLLGYSCVPPFRGAGWEFLPRVWTPASHKTLS